MTAKTTHHEDRTAHGDAVEAAKAPAHSDAVLTGVIVPVEQVIARDGEMLEVLKRIAVKANFVISTPSQGPLSKRNALQEIVRDIAALTAPAAKAPAVSEAFAPNLSPTVLQLAEDACASAIKLIGAICEDAEFEPIALRLNDQILAFRCAARPAAAPKAACPTPSPASALRLAISHIEHMSAWITSVNGSWGTGPRYSFESLGEDIDTIRAGLATFEARPAPLPEVIRVLETVGIYLQDNILEHAVVNLRTNVTLGALVETMVAQLKGAGIESPKRWRHVKRGSTYEEVGRGELQMSFVGTVAEGDELIAYRSESDGRIWFRFVEEFEDGRFEPVVS